MKKIKVNGKIEYNVYIQQNSFQKLNDLLTIYKAKKVIAIVDSNVNEEHYQSLKNKIEFIKVKTSEKHKNFVFLLEILKIFDENKIQKDNSLVLAIGGGVLLDTVGFAASIYLNGIKVAYIPTTLLAMVDGAIGSKNELHYAKRKNLIGTYYDPSFVLIDTQFLRTLELREIYSGIAEIIKIAYLMNPKIIALLEEMNSYDYNWEQVIYESIILKTKILQKDYTEKHVRKYLNFGHTFGNAIEEYYKFDKYTHGEAIAIGMCLAYPAQELVQVLKKYHLPVTLDNDIDYDTLYNLIAENRKKDNKITYVTLKEKVVPTIEELEDKAELLSRMERVRIIDESLH
ncbi:MAG: 3-dehydroquinate synthase family protein [Mycoplasmatales bacterium]